MGTLIIRWIGQNGYILRDGENEICIDPYLSNVIPTHYGMFESNTEDPQKYLSGISCGFEMKHNVEYSVKEILKNV